MYKEGGFAKFVRYEVRDGTKLLLQHDVWHAEEPLNFSYMKLFTIAHDKDVWLVDHMQFWNGNIHWNTIITRLAHE